MEQSHRGSHRLEKMFFFFNLFPSDNCLVCSDSFYSLNLIGREKSVLV